MEEIKPGEYNIPKGYRAILKNHNRVVEIKEKERNPEGYRCRDCKHFTEGYTTYHEFTTTICDLKPKTLSESMRKSIVGIRNKDKQLYYHVTKYSKVCDKFELKTV